MARSLPDSPRMLFCLQCQEIVLLCRGCDRGQMHCKSCSRERRRRSLREAAARDRRTEAGMASNRERLRRFRERQKQGLRIRAPSVEQPGTRPKPPDQGHQPLRGPAEMPARARARGASPANAPWGSTGNKDSLFLPARSKKSASTPLPLLPPALDDSTRLPVQLPQTPICPS